MEKEAIEEYMKKGDIVKLAKWTKFPHKYGLIISLEYFDIGEAEENILEEEVYNAKILVGEKIYDFHPHDFYVD